MLARGGKAQMDTRVVRIDAEAEFLTPERCAILESWNDPSDPGVSIARARVKPGVTTQLHCLDVDERYLILQGEGVAKIDELAPTAVGPGDVVTIPASTQQQITNTGESDLLFYCICSPRFEQRHYHELE
jgi:mannose-6-phosphate isomerase-like protein (cupin superfamily)